MYTIVCLDSTYISIVHLFTFSCSACTLHYTFVDIYLSQIQPKSVELVEVYGVLITRKQLDAAVADAGQSPTLLIRNLMGAFFTADVLSMSSAMGMRARPALDSDILSACIRKSVINVNVNLHVHSSLFKDSLSFVFVI